MKPDELRSRLRGVQVVLVTPMKEDLGVDLGGLAANVHTILEHGVDGFVVSGTYGEFPTLASDERVEMFRTVADAAAGRVPVIACVAHSSTREVVSLAERAVGAGADGILVAPPFLSEAGPDEVVDHFRAAADAVDVGVAIYNDPDLGTYLDTSASSPAWSRPSATGSRSSAAPTRWRFRPTSSACTASRRAVPACFRSWFQGYGSTSKRTMSPKPAGCTKDGARTGGSRPDWASPPP